ncbi:MAG TPA: DUF1353 domain-containing protein [Allosphingosinicella sp.]|jgi:hypothetical protein
MRFAASILVLVSVATSANAQPPGKFSGNPQVELAPDGRTAKLLKKFSYTDLAGNRWVVPSGTMLDGASIPSPFWSFIGGPWEGKYRNASIIHDFYCDRKTRPWQAVHRVFYNGMISAGVDPVRASIMYYAVYKFGPRWRSTVTKVPGVGFDGQPTMLEKSVVVDIPPPAYDPEDVERDQQLIMASQLTLEQIEALADDR